MEVTTSKETTEMEHEGDQPEDITLLRKENERQAQDITALRQVAQMLGEQLIVARMKSEGGSDKEPGRVLILEKRVKQLQHGLRAAIKQRDHFQRLAASHTRLSTVPEAGSPPSPTQEEVEEDQERAPESPREPLEEGDGEGEYFSDDIAARALASHEAATDNEGNQQPSNTSQDADLNGTAQTDALEAQTKLCNQLIEENTRLQEDNARQKAQLSRTDHDSKDSVSRRDEIQKLARELSEELSRVTQELSLVAKESTTTSMSSVDERIKILAMLDASEDRCVTLQEEVDALLKDRNGKQQQIAALERDMMLLSHDRQARRSTHCERTEAATERWLSKLADAEAAMVFWIWAHAAAQPKNSRVAHVLANSPSAAAASPFLRAPPPASFAAPPPANQSTALPPAPAPAPASRRIVFDAVADDQPRPTASRLLPKSAGSASYAAEPRHVISDSSGRIGADSTLQGAGSFKVQGVGTAGGVRSEGRRYTAEEWNNRNRDAPPLSSSSTASALHRQVGAAPPLSSSSSVAASAEQRVPTYQRQQAPHSAGVPSTSGGSGAVAWGQASASAASSSAGINAPHSAPSTLRSSYAPSSSSSSSRIPASLLESIASPQTRARYMASSDHEGPRATDREDPRLAQAAAPSPSSSAGGRDGWDRRVAYTARSPRYHVTETAEPPATSLILTAEWLATVGDRESPGESPPTPSRAPAQEEPRTPEPQQDLKWPLSSRGSEGDARGAEARGFVDLSEEVRAARMQRGGSEGHGGQGMFAYGMRQDGEELELTV